MPKYRRCRRRFRRKGRWSCNIKQIVNNTITATEGSFFADLTLCENPQQLDNTVSQQYTCKNVELSYEIETPSNPGIIESLTAYILFVPQGFVITETLPSTHPEWIMAYRFLGSPNSELASGSFYQNPGRLPTKIKTRLSRRLQTGDKIILLVTGNNETTTSINLVINGLLRWWTKAN